MHMTEQQDVFHVQKHSPNISKTALLSIFYLDKSKKNLEAPADLIKACVAFYQYRVITNMGDKVKIPDMQV